MRIRSTLSLILFSLLSLLLAACQNGGEAVAVTRGLPEANAAAVEAVATEAAPRGGGPTFGFRLWTGDGRPIHGAPPFDARLSADFYDWSRGLPAPCAQLQWQFGDGQQESAPCASGDGAAHDWQTVHRYDAPGIYHASATMLLENGATIDSEKSQTVLVAAPQSPSLGATAVRWLGWLLLLTATGLALIVIAFQRGRRRLLSGLLLALLLITFVPPFSYVPDPLGVVLTVAGAYEDDLRLPFANRFLVAGDPTRPLRPTLDALIGQTGLDPLDPNFALSRYDFLKIRKEAYHTAVVTRFTYANGEQRSYAIPLRQPSEAFRFYDRDWRYDGLGRLRSAHEALPPVPAAGGAPFGLLQRVAGPPAEGGLAQEWFGAAANPLAPRLLWSPGGDAFLTMVAGNGNSTLWLSDLQSGATSQLAGNVWSYAWRPDGEGVVYSTVENDLTASASGFIMQIKQVRREGGRGMEPAQQLLALPLGQNAFPGVNEQGLWFVRDGALWLLPWDAAGGEAQQLTPLPGLQDQPRREPVKVYPSPDGQRVAYSCAAGLCLIDAGGGNHAVAAADARFVSLAWRGDGEQLAAAFWQYPGASPSVAELRLFARDGQRLAEVVVAAEGIVDAPQWLPDGETLLLQSYPQDGRRIIRAHPASGAVADLSQPRWDAFFALHPDGERLLLSNGRGGVWLTSLQGD